MKKNRARAPKIQIVRPRRSELVIGSLIFAGTITILTLIVLRWCHVPLGQQFNYRYSELAELKTATGLWPIVLLLLPIVLSARWVDEPRTRKLGLSLGM